MKIAPVQNIDKKFEPFILPILVESVDDAAKLHALFNQCSILSYLGIPTGDSFRDFITQNSSVPHNKRVEEFNRICKLFNGR
jgi:hypothetical protein